ncbi:putative solute:sodium symporter small subunit [Herbaspirillum sp. Sphag1AN]|uniref:DUF4212 domain-containing protein n=1 Tax=unclassified Herbaspirillum TaxID=2624150 RepID=UPI001619881E|nr:MULTISPECIES: DUF4212 domain-containing protein [unclassified Herbaspirillum]MBB3212832.1 putative solute:sodium symporter small subunit [Herbaspirillum sp. Sphag1AN]MBB3246029.1 putative solute:sodium symporter small subunit [Herbaspirillum sp. Sphag64]
MSKHDLSDAANPVIAANKTDAVATAPTLSTNSYWQKTQRLTLGLLLVWFVMTFGTIFFARELDRFHLFGWPVSFYLAAQGIMLLYLLIVVLYTVIMGRLERRLHPDIEQTHGE